MKSSLWTKLGLCVGLSALILAAGCTTTRKLRKVETTGFLGDYSMMKKGDRDQAQLVYFKPGLNLAKYHKVIIDPITFMAQADSDASKLPQEEIQNLADRLYIAIQNHLQGDYEQVQTPGPDVLRIKAAITDARGSKVAMNVVTTIIPQINMVSKVSGLATDTTVFVGKAGVEAEVVDSLTNERLIAAVDERAGAKTLRGLGGTWKDVQEAYDFWAQRLKERLAEFRGAAPAPKR